MLGGGLNVAAGGINNDDTELGGGRDVDIVDTHAGAGNDFEILCCGEELGCHLGL
jgi:hypothetical protein